MTPWMFDTERRQGIAGWEALKGHNITAQGNALGEGLW